MKESTGVSLSASDEGLMTKPYFVMLYNQKGDSLIPMSDWKSELSMFESAEEAHFAAMKTVFGEHFGFQVFREGDGE